MIDIICLTRFYVEIYNAGPSIKFAFYNALFGMSNGSFPSNTPTCATGKCTWPSYSSLAVCSACTNLSSDVYRNDNPVARGWWLPNDANLEDSEYYSLAIPHKPMVYKQTVNQSIWTVNLLWHDIPANAAEIKPQAAECILHFCVKTFSTSMVAGIFTENVTSVWPMPNDLILNTPNFYIGDWPAATAPSDFNITEVVLKPPGQDESFRVDTFTFFWFKRWMTQMISWEIGGLAQFAHFEGSSGDLSTDGSTGDLSRAMHERLKEHEDCVGGPVKAIMDRFANAFTAAIRTKATKNLMVDGTALGVETFVKARWGWAILPITLVGLTCLFMMATLALTIKHKVPVWKSSALATLAHGLDEASGELVTADKLDEIERKSEAYQTVIQGDMRHWKLRTGKTGPCS